MDSETELELIAAAFSESAACSEPVVAKTRKTRKEKRAEKERLAKLSAEATITNSKKQAEEEQRRRRREERIAMQIEEEMENERREQVREEQAKLQELYKSWGIDLDAPFAFSGFGEERTNLPDLEALVLNYFNVAINKTIFFATVWAPMKRGTSYKTILTKPSRAIHIVSLHGMKIGRHMTVVGKCDNGRTILLKGDMSHVTRAKRTVLCNRHTVVPTNITVTFRPLLVQKEYWTRVPTNNGSLTARMIARNYIFGDTIESTDEDVCDDEIDDDTMEALEDETSDDMQEGVVVDIDTTDAV